MNILYKEGFVTPDFETPKFKTMGGCSVWLLGYLFENGPTLVCHVKEAAKPHGYNRGDLKKARKEAGVKTYYAWYVDAWYWHLPNQKVGNQQ